MSLIKSITELKKYLALDQNTKLTSLQPFIDEAEQLYIVPLLGKAFYDYYLPLYEASVAPSPTALSAANAALLPYIQRALAYYMQVQATNNLSLTFGELGLRVHRSDDSDPAPRWQQEKLLYAALRNGDIHADRLLEFMEANANDYTAWRDSTANTSRTGLIVYNTTVASKHIRINNSRRVYLKLVDTIRDIETRIIPKLISKEQYDELVTAIKAGTTDSQEKALIAKLEPIICKRALYLQLQFMRVQINENGLFVYSGTDDLYKLGQLASDADIKILRAQLMDDELGYLADEQALQQFILDNIEDYPLIKASAVYTVQPDPGPVFTPTNSELNKHFIV